MKEMINLFLKDKVQIIEVAPRDGFQFVKKQIPTETKIQAINTLYQAGFERMEIGSFVSPKALPQMADIKEIFAKIPTEKKKALRFWFQMPKELNLQLLQE